MSVVCVHRQRRRGTSVRQVRAERILVALFDGLYLDRSGLLHERPPTPGLAGVAVSFVVADVDATTAAAQVAGAVVIDAPADQPWGERQSVFTDPDGHVVCLVSLTTP